MHDVSTIVVWKLYYRCIFFFKQKTAYEMRSSDWSSDVCSSDLRDRNAGRRGLWLGGGGMRMVHAETRRRGENIETLKPFALSLSKGRSFLQRGRSEEHTSELQSLMRI